jgi:hypothetical protein
MTTPTSRPEPQVVEGTVLGTSEVLALLMPTPPKHLPVTQHPACRCGKGSLEAHGYIPDRRRTFTCDEVLAIRARDAFAARPLLARLLVRLRHREPTGWRRCPDDPEGMWRP